VKLDGSVSWHFKFGLFFLPILLICFN